MKLRKILAVVVAISFVLGIGITPAAANTSGTMTMRPGAGAASYEVKVEGRVTITSQTYRMNDTITLDNSLLPKTGSTGVQLRRTSDGKTLNINTVKEVKFLGSTIEAGNTNVTIGFQTGPNQIVGGAINTFRWEATLVLSDPAKHPINDEGFTSSGFSFVKTGGGNINPFFNIPVYGSDGVTIVSTTDVYFENWTMTSITNVAASAFIPTGENLPSATYLGNGTLIDAANAIAFRDATTFQIVLNFDKAGTGQEFFGITTNISGTANRSGASVNGSRSLTIDIPKSFFFDTAGYNAMASFNPSPYNYLLTWLRVTATNLGSTTLNISSIDIRWSGATTNNNNNNNNDSDAVPELTLNYKALTLGVGANHSTTILRADGFSPSELTYSIVSPGKNNDVITIFNTGRIRALKRGTVTVRVRDAKSGAEEFCTVEVVAMPSRPITNITFKATGGTVYVGGVYNLSTTANATITPSNHNDTIQWFSSDNEIATVSRGTVRVVGTGRVTITAVSRSGVQRTRTLTARAANISLSPTSATIDAGKTYTIRATGQPNNSSNTLSYRSLNTSVATVSSRGVVTGVKKGTARIEITSKGGAVKTFTITVR